MFEGVADGGFALIFFIAPSPTHSFGNDQSIAMKFLASSPPPLAAPGTPHPAGWALELLAAAVPHPRRLEHRVQAARTERVAAGHQHPRHDRHVAVQLTCVVCRTSIWLQARRIYSIYK